MNQGFGDHHFTHQENDLVASLDAALWLSSVGSNGRKRNALVDHGECRKAVVDQATDELQIEVIDEVVGDDA